MGKTSNNFFFFFAVPRVLLGDIGSKYREIFFTTKYVIQIKYIILNLNDHAVAYFEAIL